MRIGNKGRERCGYNAEGVKEQVQFPHGRKEGSPACGEGKVML